MYNNYEDDSIVLLQRQLVSVQSNTLLYPVKIYTHTYTCVPMLIHIIFTSSITPNRLMKEIKLKSRLAACKLFDCCCWLHFRISLAPECRLCTCCNRQQVTGNKPQATTVPRNLSAVANEATECTFRTDNDRQARNSVYFVLSLRDIILTVCCWRLTVFITLRRKLVSSPYLFGGLVMLEVHN